MFQCICEIDLIYLTDIINMHGICNAITINAVTFSQNGIWGHYNDLHRELNKYIKNNNLDIKLKIILFTEANATTQSKDDGELLSSLFSRESTKYDIIFYDNVYTNKFAPYLVNLRDYLPKEHIELFEPGITPEICTYNNKLIEYLKKYNKTAPKTWDELIETSSIIRDGEKNSELVNYNGLFPGFEIGTCSLWEFIYSFRNSYNDTYPDFPSKEAEEAILMLKKIKDSLSSEEEFRKADEYTITRLIDSKFSFVKYWYSPQMSHYVMTPIPGKKEGLSGSVIGGYNIAINKLIDEERIRAAAEIV
ncbi:hypothetical protein PIROE2DRAFT_59740 [Piromyces sp. E2]|nr:hypothetical protein PIROE2DRAFT_59740 [Piromyces sp. E2]|eukprot:OUM65896.1 hypothetical protein PIROE2DRAFT_59740 [Piromyces sp. E2]